MANETDTKQTTTSLEINTVPDKAIAPGKTASSKKVITKRLSKSKRTHIRRMKAEARREGVVYRPRIE